MLSTAASLVALALAAGCTSQPAGHELPGFQMVEEPIPLEPMTRPLTPEELYGEPRPPTDPLLEEVLDGLWARQLQLDSLLVVVRTEITEGFIIEGVAGGTGKREVEVTGYLWHARWGFREVDGGDVRNPDLPPRVVPRRPGQRPDEAREYRPTAPLDLLDLPGASTIESAFRRDPDGWSAHRGEWEGEPCIVVEWRRTDTGEYRRFWFAPAKGYVALHWEAFVFFELGLERHPSPSLHLRGTVLQIGEVKPGLWVPQRHKTFQTIEDAPKDLLPGGRVDREIVTTTTDIEANPEIDPEVFRTMLRRLPTQAELDGRQ